MHVENDMSNNFARQSIEEDYVVIVSMIFSAADPAPFVLADSTGHMVTPFIFFDNSLALRTPIRDAFAPDHVPVRVLLRTNSIRVPA